MTEAECLFCRIVAGEVPAHVVHDTERLLAFRDIAPKAPVHVLVIPKQHYVTIAELAADDRELAGALLDAAGAVATSHGLAVDGYRLLFNTGRHGGQEVPHVHAHVLGGRPLGPMLTSAAG